jgi:hypothetical protein
MNSFRPAMPALSLAIAVTTARLLAQQPAPPPAAELSAEAIMARVATNQDRAEAERRHYVYLQHARVISRKGKTVMCEEITDYRITPTDQAYNAELVKLNGRLLRKKNYITYTTLAPAKDASQNKGDASHDSLDLDDDDTDRDLVEHMRMHLINDKSKDGIESGLFPLTSKGQADYLFHLVGNEHINGRDVFHIDFRPKVKDDYGWKGDAYIDTASFEPVVIRTDMARKIPFAVRTLLGTNVPGLGFNVVYAPQPDGVWFPVTFGTEFKLHVLFFFSRNITINADNRDFQKTHVSSKILDAAPPEPKP